MFGLTRILSIDGGGIRGMIPGQILITLEEMLIELSKNKAAKLGDFFDFIAGTSTGGIMACLYLCPEEKNHKKPRLSAKQVVEFYDENAGAIFSSSLFYQLKTLHGYIGAKYPVAAIEHAVKKYFHNLELKQLIKPCLIPAFDIHKQGAHFFTQHTAKKNKKSNYLVKDVVRATSAAPTYFQPATIHSMAGKTYSFVDGGVFAGNPALCAYVEARKLDNHPEVENMLILSLGTGQVHNPDECKKAKNWGKIQWIEPLMDILLNGSTEIVDYQLQRIFEAVDKPDQYLRINPTFDKEHLALNSIDNASRENLDALKEFGALTAKKYHKKLENMAKLLVENQDFADLSTTGSGRI